MADNKPTWRRKSTGASRYAKMLALGASLITGAPKTNPNADTPAQPQEKIQNVAQKPGGAQKAPSLPDAPTTGADQIKEGIPQALPQENVDEVIQGVDNDDRRDDVHDALSHERDQKNKNQNDNQNQGNKDSSSQSPHKPKTPKSSQLPTTQPAAGSGIKGAEQAAKNEGKQVVKQAASKVAKEAIKATAKAVWMFILANLEWIIPVVIGLIVAFAFIAFIVYVYCLFPPSPCGKSGNLMAKLNSMRDMNDIATLTGDRLGFGYDPNIKSDPVLASRIVKIAQSQVGNHEVGRSDCGSTIAGYFVPHSCGQPWCAYFATWVLNEAGADIQQMASAKNVEDYYRKYHRWSNTPQPGDIFTVTRSGGSGRHIGIVVGVNGDGTFASVEGNAGSPGQVKYYKNYRHINEAVGFGRPL